LIRPLLRANATRLHNVHVVIFFIFLVANIGGALTPLGDPPLFVGFLHGVDFFWTTRYLALQTASIAGVLLVLFFAIDWFWYRRDRRIELLGERDRPLALSIKGWINVPLIGGIIAAILVSAMWRPGIVFNVDGTELALQNLVRDAVLLVLAAMSLVFTPNEHREVNGFSWEPILEVAKLFAGIFICVIPVLAMLRAGPHGSLAFLFERVTLANGHPHDVAYFWLAGLLSALLDNAPTYLVFFELAGGNAEALMSQMGSTLAAISAGAVYMGALTYIGNAPNFMVYAIATERGVKMPSFFGYLAWSAVILLPIFAIMTLVML
jgi:Na+/H+ antiporter NhaD/arsenite permease-like protein